MSPKEIPFANTRKSEDDIDRHRQGCNHCQSQEIHPRIPAAPVGSSVQEANLISCSAGTCWLPLLDTRP